MNHVKLHNPQKIKSTMSPSTCLHLRPGWLNWFLFLPGNIIGSKFTWLLCAVPSKQFWSTESCLFCFETVWCIRIHFLKWVYWFRVLQDTSWKSCVNQISHSPSYFCLWRCGITVTHLLFRMPLSVFYTHSQSHSVRYSPNPIVHICINTHAWIWRNENENTQRYEPKLTQARTHTPPCMDLIASVFVITTLQEVERSTWVPCSGIHSEWTLCVKTFSNLGNKG